YEWTPSKGSGASGSRSLAGLRLGESRHQTGRQAEEEDRRGDEADRNTPLDDRRRVGLRCAPGHPAPEGHGEEDDVHAVVRDAEDREEGGGEEDVGALPKRLAAPEHERRAAAEKELAREGHTEPSGERSGQLIADRHVSEAKHEVDEERPERD